MRLVIIVILACALTQAEKARFDYYRVYKVAVENDQQFNVMKEIQNFPNGYQFWHEPQRIGSNVEIVVPPHKFGEWSDLTERFNLKSTMMISNLQEVIDKENNNMKRSSKARGDWNTYWDLNEINLWLDELVNEFSEILTPIDAGETFQGRKIRGVKLSHGTGENPKRAVVLEGTIHAREWISGATVTWILNELLRSTDPDVQELAQSYDWYVFPITNPDGYNYTWSTNRMWRKNRKPGNILCYGIDLNRNYDNHHGGDGSSDNPCLEKYGGPYAFSEPETLHFSQYLKTISNLHSYFSFHSIGQLLMLPYGWTEEIPEDYARLFEIGSAGQAAIRMRHGTEYKLGTIANIIWLASGISTDWVYDELNPNFALAYELRDTGEHGFLLPADQIIGTAEETFDSLLAMLKKIDEVDG